MYQKLCTTETCEADSPGCSVDEGHQEPPSPTRHQARSNQIEKTTYNENVSVYIKKLKEIKNKFFRKSLSSKDPKAVWSTINRILNNNCIDKKPFLDNGRLFVSLPYQKLKPQ